MISIFMTYCFAGVCIIMQVIILVFTEGNLQHCILASVWLHCVDIYEEIPSLTWDCELYFL